MNENARSLAMTVILNVLALVFVMMLARHLVLPYWHQFRRYPE